MTRRMITRDSMESLMFASSLIPAVVQKILDEAVAIVVSSSDDFLLSFRRFYEGYPSWTGMFSKIPQGFPLKNVSLEYPFWTIPPFRDSRFGLSHRCHQKFLICDVLVARMSSAKRRVVGIFYCSKGRESPG